MAPRRRIGRIVSVHTPGYTGPVHIREDGPSDSPVLVLIHGFSGSLHWFDQAVPLLHDDFRIIRPDLLGHGSTGGAAVDAPAQAAVLHSVLDQLKVTDVTVIGHSFGADVAVELAERCARVARLVIVAQAPDYSDAVLPRGWQLMTTPVLRSVLRAAALGAGTTLAGAFRVLRSRRVSEGLVAQALSDFRALDVRMFRVVLVDRRDRLAARPLDEQLRSAGKPTLVILGERDHFYGARSAPRYRAAGADVHSLPESGHSPFVEFPEPTADLVRAFVTTASAEQRSG